MAKKTAKNATKKTAKKASARKGRAKSKTNYKIVETIKTTVGARIREAREGIGYSRAALGDELGISGKTIQSWEMGRTFIERLDLILKIENVLDIRIGEVLQESLDGVR